MTVNNRAPGMKFGMWTSLGRDKVVSKKELQDTSPGGSQVSDNAPGKRSTESLETKLRPSFIVWSHHKYLLTLSEKSEYVLSHPGNTDVKIDMTGRQYTSMD